MARYFVAIDANQPMEYYEYIAPNPNSEYGFPFVMGVPLQQYTFIPCEATGTETMPVTYIPNTVDAVNYSSNMPMHLICILGNGDYLQNGGQEQHHLIQLQPEYQQPQYQQPQYQPPQQRCEISELIQTDSAVQTDPYGMALDMETDRQFLDDVLLGAKPSNRRRISPDEPADTGREREPSVAQSRKKYKKRRNNRNKVYRAEQGYLVEEPTDDDEQQQQQ